MISVTIGTTKSQSIWDEKKTIEWDVFCGWFEASPVGDKDGSCFVPATFMGNARSKDHAVKIDVIVLDSDAGHTFAELIGLIKSKGYSALVHSTHSHMTTETRVSSVALAKYESAGGNVKGFMIEKKGYLDRISASAIKSTNLGKDTIIRHDPVPKFRVIFPLAKSWRADDYGDIVEANAAWKEQIGSFAEHLGIDHDQSCTDTSRLFYMPRRAMPDNIYEYEVLKGKEVSLDTLPDRLNTDAPLFAKAETDPAIHNGKNLTSWAFKFSKTFQIADLLQERKSGVFTSRLAGVKRHINCPFGDEHTSSSDETGTFVVNASDIRSSGLTQINGFTVQCSHNSCSTRDRLDFIAKMISLGWFQVGDLDDERFHIAIEQTKINLGQVLDAPEDETIPPFPEPLGLLHEIKQYLLETSRYKHPELALAAAISLVAVAAGQVFAFENLRTNLYLIGLAPSGSGKGHVIGAIDHILRDSEMVNLLGASAIASGAGVISRMIDHPSTLYALDEFGIFMKAMASDQAGFHIKEIIGIFMELYTKANSVYTTKDRADRKDHITREVINPCLSVFGVTNETHVWGSMTKDSITDGSIGRFICFKARTAFPKPTPCLPMASTPFVITQGLQDIHAARQNRQKQFVGNIDDPIWMDETDRARSMFRDAEELEWVQKTKHYADDTGLHGIVGRKVEGMKKLAMIHAISRGSEEIHEDDVIWSEAILDITQNVMLNGIIANVSNSKREAFANSILQAIKKTGKQGYSKTRLAQQFRNIDKRLRTEIMDDLVEACQIAQRGEGKLGTVRVKYFAMKGAVSDKQYFAKQGEVQ